MRNLSKAALNWLYRMRGRSRAYKACFLDENGELTESGRVVLADLAKFCRAHKSSVHISPINRTVDPYATVHTEGRREVYLQILTLLRVSEDQIFEMARVRDGNASDE
ncbi:MULTISPECIES: hypothetical protein [unclassified Caballeronia]|uniref:Bbp19 family protein n=1 Tax=unclassified Caballeronia TaxID=2646786 RepID=UPI001F226DB6|nr:MULTISPECIES: hypothetical protein [unclassified Caballeronia]MCE4544601.1 hypothetical protein [Caballeronia sp. PC1]MCE4571753.1 hypothetical protein [Caballeronia sp. CLC5]